MKPTERLWALSNYLQKNGSGPVGALPDPDPDLFLSVVIPAYKEDAILSSIRSLLACDPPGVRWEILVHVNYPENADDSARLASIRSDSEVRGFGQNGHLPRRQVGLRVAHEMQMHRVPEPQRLAAGQPDRHLPQPGSFRLRTS
ncbi:MAG: hypothetical protein R6V75_11025 [Bacteroidales bacterium]